MLNKIEKFNCCKSIKKDQFEIKYLEKIYKKIQDEYKNERIYEINLSDYSYTFDVSALNFNSTRGFNTYWFNSEIDWIIEKNHEGWYNLYGSWLENNIPELKYYKDY